MTSWKKLFFFFFCFLTNQPNCARECGGGTTPKYTTATSTCLGKWQQQHNYCNNSDDDDEDFSNFQAIKFSEGPPLGNFFVKKLIFFFFYIWAKSNSFLSQLWLLAVWFLFGFLFFFCFVAEEGIKFNAPAQ